MGFDVVLGGVLGMLGGVGVMAVSQMSVVRGGLVIAFGVMLRGFMVVTRSVLVVLRCLGVVLGCFVGHGNLSCATLGCIGGLSRGGARVGVTRRRMADENQSRSRRELAYNRRRSLKSTGMTSPPPGPTGVGGMFWARRLSGVWALAKSTW